MKKRKTMNVLSLFDGISCGRVALERAGLPVKNYFASEIDKWAIRVSGSNYPDIHQIGDVCSVKADSLPKIDLLIGGSPCQGFSFAGKGLNFADPRSALFFEYVRVLNEIRKTNPGVIFLLENVPMKRSHQMVISKYLGVEPIEINASLVSAQNRSRLFWTNIKAQPFNLFGDLSPTIPQPTDKKILIQDILELPNKVDKKYHLNGARLKRMLEKQGKYTQLNGEKSYAVTSSHDANWGGDFLKLDVYGNMKPSQTKASCFTAGGHSAGNHSDMDLIFTEARIRGDGGGNTRMVFDKSPSITAIRWENNNYVCGIAIRGRYKENGETGQFLEIGGEKANAYTLTEKTSMVSDGSFYRRYTPVEVERLFTLPDGYTSAVSDSQRYRLMGNGWVVDVIAHILSQIKA